MTGPRARCTGLLAAVLLMAASDPVSAWGPEGHRIVGELAARELRPATAAAVAALLAGEPEPTLAGVANEADRHKTEATGPLHYINFPPGRCDYQPARDCPDGRCVIAAIERAMATVGDRQAAAADRRLALKNLVHFVGDLHQPLHAGRAADRGGNTVALRWHGEPRNLHQLWDSALIRAIGSDATRLAARLARRRKPAASILAGPPAAWAQQSCRLVASPDFYPARETFDEAAYQRRWQPVLETQLQRAGLRLAALLERALGR